MLQLASNRKPFLASTIGPIFTHHLGRGRVDFRNSLNPYISKTIKNIEKQRDLVGAKFKVVRISLYIFFDISNGF